MHQHIPVDVTYKHLPPAGHARRHFEHQVTEDPSLVTRQEKEQTELLLV
jgi:hypothetical protein